MATQNIQRKQVLSRRTQTPLGTQTRQTRQVPLQQQRRGKQTITTSSKETIQQAIRRTYPDKEVTRVGNEFLVKSKPKEYVTRYDTTRRNRKIKIKDTYIPVTITLDLQGNVTKKIYQGLQKIRAGGNSRGQHYTRKPYKREIIN